jgi:hypothetical protein
MRRQKRMKEPTTPPTMLPASTPTLTCLGFGFEVLVGDEVVEGVGVDPSNRKGCFECQRLV